MKLKIFEVDRVGALFLSFLSLGFLILEVPGHSTAHAQATEIAAGIVSVSGSAANAQTKLTESGSNSGTVVTLCRTAVSKRIGRVTGMSVTVNGVWSSSPVSKEKCLDVKSFKVVKVSSGRDAVVGKLLKQESNFVVVTEDGKRYGLNSVPAGLSKLEGKEVIIDVKPLDSPATAEGAIKASRVVTYAEHP